jgi:hypothetical protein
VSTALGIMFPTVNAGQAQRVPVLVMLNRESGTHMVTLQHKIIKCSVVRMEFCRELPVSACRPSCADTVTSAL